MDRLIPARPSMINLQMVCELGSVLCDPDPEDMDDVGLNEGKPLVCDDSSISNYTH